MTNEMLPDWALRLRGAALGLLDSSAWIVAISLAAFAGVSASGGEIDWMAVAWLVVAAVLAQTAFGLAARGLVGAFRIGSVEEVLGSLRSWIGTSVVIAACNALLLGQPISMPALLLSIPTALCLMLGVRLAWRVAQDRFRRPQLGSGRKKVIVFGAGEGGDQIVRAMMRDVRSDYVPVAILDDDENKRHRQISGVRVRGTREDLASTAKVLDADVLLIAIPSATSVLFAELDELATSLGLEVLVLPSTSELVGMLTTNDIRELSEADLLGRSEVEVDMESIRSYISGKRVLVTGAGGSIGSELARQLAQLDCESLIMLDRDESGLHSTQLAIEGKALLDTRCLVVADIRDRARIFEVFEEHKPHVVFHTAALKHLTLLEQYPEEGRKTNVEGSRNLLDAAELSGVECYVNVSTDKAADPTSVLGRTKLEAEQLTAAKASTAAGKFVSVRFGNVLGSRGSVLPIFRHQIARGGPITVTHPDVTRYFMTIPEAVRLVLQAGAIGRPAEVMILDMGEPVKIVDLANQLIKHYGTECDIVFTGLRPGEKMDEILVSQDEIAVTREHARIMHALPHDTTRLDARVID